MFVYKYKKFYFVNKRMKFISSPAVHTTGLVATGRPSSLLTLITEKEQIWDLIEWGWDKGWSPAAGLEGSGDVNDLK